MKMHSNSASVNDNKVVIMILQLTLKLAKGALHPLKRDLKKMVEDERELMHIMSGLKRMRRITATLGDQERGGETLSVCF